MKNIKNNLSKYRAWKNINQDELATNLGLSTYQLRMIELNRKYPKDKVRESICAYFNVNNEQMFYLDD